MQKITAILERFKWPLALIIVAAVAVYVLVVGFGETLGVDAGVRTTVARTAERTWQLAVTLLLPVLAKDSDGDGVPDVIDVPSDPPPPLSTHIGSDR